MKLILILSWVVDDIYHFIFLFLDYNRCLEAHAIIIQSSQPEQTLSIFIIHFLYFCILNSFIYYNCSRTLLVIFILSNIIIYKMNNNIIYIRIFKYIPGMYDDGATNSTSICIKHVTNVLNLLSTTIINK